MKLNKTFNQYLKYIEKSYLSGVTCGVWTNTAFHGMV